MAAIVKGVDWLSLLPEIMDLIVKRIDGYRDFIVFGSVCKTFYFATASVKHPESPPSFPLLMLADGTEWEKEQQPQLNQIIPPPRCFHDIFHSTTLDVNLPEAYGRLCLGTKFGWLLTLNRDQEINLLHPFSKRQINLPNIHSLLPENIFNEEFFRRYFPCSIDKACVSCLPADRKNCIVFAIFTDTGEVAFTRLAGDNNEWRLVNTQGGCVDDIIYHKGLLYAVNFEGVVFRSSYINEEDIFSNGAPIAVAPPKIKWTFRRYLVELDGDLLLVVRVHRNPFPLYICCTDDFVIYRMEEVDDDEAGSERYPNKWVKVESLGNRALFLSASASVSQPSVGDHNFIKGNCIYFTDEHGDDYFPRGYGGYDSGIFHVEDKTIERHYTGPSGIDYRTHVWYI